MAHKTQTLLLTAFLVLGTPLAFAQEAVSLRADDTVAGLGTDVIIAGLTEPALLIVLPPVGAAIEQQVQSENERVRLTGSDLEVAGIYALVLDRDGISLASAEFEVLPEQLDVSNAALQAEGDALTADGQDELSVRVILRDRYGNPVSERPVSLISSRASDAIEAKTQHTDERGEQQFTLRTYEAGSMIVRAVDLVSGQTLSAELPIRALPPSQNMGGAAPRTLYGSADRGTVAATPSYGTQVFGSIDGRTLYGQVASFDVVQRFILDAPMETNVNVDENLTITAVDREGRVVEDFAGTVELSSTDPDAILPSFGTVQFRGADLGRKTLVLGLRFATPGEHILYAQDARDPSITGETVITVIDDTPQLPQQSISITAPEEDSMVNSREVVLEGEAPPYVNLIVTGGTEDVYGESDADGNFAITVPLHPDQVDHTLRVRDESGRHDSGNLRLKLDIEPPEVLSFRITPENPVQESDVLATARVTDNSGKIGSVVLSIGAQEYPLTPATETGSYQVLFVARDLGTVEPALRVTDEAGNMTEVRSTLTVGSKALPIVQNLQASPEPNAVKLTWDRVVPDDDGPINGYRLYVGESADDFPFTFETVEPLAEVGGLRPGTRYFFAVTAFRGEQESDRNESVSASPLGIALEVVPGNSSLTLKWTKLQSIPLGSFRLEYGVEPGVYTEERSLNGDLVTYTVRDLLNDVPYYVRLTPITTTGDVLEELAVTGGGTPTSALEGFQPGPADPIPLGLGSIVDTPPLHTGAPPPEQPTTGIPSLGWWLLIAAAGGAGVYVRQRRRTLRATETFLRDMHQRYTESPWMQLG